MANLWNNVVLRRDLNLCEGLMVSQGAHIAKKFMLDKIIKMDDAPSGASEDLFGELFTEDELNWMRKPYLNILAVDNVEELQEVIKMGRNAGIQVCEWRDTIPMKNINRPLDDVLIGASFGPADLDLLKLATGTLPRL